MEAVDDLSLGISIVVAVLLGVGLGYLLVYIFDIFWLFWIGVFWGVGGAILNIYKAYKRQIKSLEEYVKKERSID
jgi:F0F1-type ATP synthase assembly protein I